MRRVSCKVMLGCRPAQRGDVPGSGIYRSALYGRSLNSLPALRGRRLDGQVTDATGKESVADGMPADDID